MSSNTFDKKMWKMWKQGKSLTEIVTFVSDYTCWSGYLSLVHVVRYLHGEKKIRIDKKQLRKVFNSTRGDFDREDERSSWKFLLEKAGYLLLFIIF